MIDYVELLLADIPQQYKNRPKIVALIRALGRQLNELIEFYGQLYTDRFISTAEGKQLDLIGNILVLTRKEAKDMLGLTEDISDERYRQLLVYKAQLNFGDGTYTSIMNCLKIIHGEDLPFWYVEELEHPATLILETKEKPSTEIVKSMIETPVPRAGGVGLLIRATEERDMMYGTGITSQVAIEQSFTMEEVDFENDIIGIEDENGYMLADENWNLLVDKSSEIIGVPNEPEEGGVGG